MRDNRGRTLPASPGHSSRAR